MAERILVLSSERRWASGARAVVLANPDWVVIVHPTDDPLPLFFAFRPEELPPSDIPDDRAIDQVLELTRDWASGVAYGSSIVWDPGELGEAAQRVVTLSPANRVIRVAPAVIVERGLGVESWDPAAGRSQEIRIRSGPPTKVDAIFSAGLPEEIEVDVPAEVSYRIELGLIMPDGRRFSAGVEPGAPIIVRVSAEGPDVTFHGPREQTVAIESNSVPVTGAFTMTPTRSGLVRVAVHFRHAESDVGAVLLAAMAVRQTTAVAPVMVEAPAVMPAPPTEGLLTLVIDHQHEHGALIYSYQLHSEELGFHYARRNSRPVGDRGQGPAATVQEYIQGIYGKVTVELRSVNDAAALQVEAKALGVELSHELLEPDVVEALWPIRHRIRCIQVTSFEAYVPWEMIRMQNPRTGEVDDRFFAEYGLIRTMSGETPPRQIALERWAYLQAEFPNDSHAAVSADRSFFEEVLPAHGVQAARIAADQDAFFEVVRNGELDVLHLSCHAASDSKAIDRARLVIGDKRDAGGQVRPIEISSATIRSEARLRPRQPLVFLNACETGVLGVVLTSYGGWPEVFCRAGAGVFVGTSWAVREQPAAKFASTFYRHLMGGCSLAQAAAAARAAAKTLGDVSWLAYKVYGHPAARIASPVWPIESDDGPQVTT